jgi:hypothetical protein
VGGWTDGWMDVCMDGGKAGLWDYLVHSKMCLKAFKWETTMAYLTKLLHHRKKCQDHPKTWKDAVILKIFVRNSKTLLPKVCIIFSFSQAESVF